MPEHGGLIARLTSYFRWLLFAVLVCAAGLVVFRQLVLDQLDEQIRGRVESMLAGHYRDMDVQIRAARRIEGQGIEIRGLLIRSLHEATAYRDLVYIDEMILSCQADLGDLLCGRPNINQLTVRRMKLRATCYQKGEWNIAHLLPLPNFGGSIPEINIEDSTVELQDLCRKATSEKIWAIRNVNLKAASRLSAAGQQQWEFNGKLLGDHFKNVKLQGLVDAEEGRWSAWGTMDGLEMSQRLLDAAPNDVARYLSPLATLRALRPISLFSWATIPMILNWCGYGLTVMWRKVVYKTHDSPCPFLTWRPMSIATIGRYESRM